MAERRQVEVLDRAQCLSLLGTARVGRVVFTEDALPAVHPVNFRLHEGDVVIRVAGGGKLAAATGHLVVAFQADELDHDLREGWSVTVVGRAEVVEDVASLVEMAGTWLEPWAEGPRNRFVRIRTEKVTGRRLRAPAHHEG
jgi:nitroimidazol reductase NimA-like FMN-containing flavoprotein (pyridoxamine 5'-phosphate oxidase superfamily)